MKRDAKQALLDAGLELVHAQGFHRTGLTEILRSAQVPKGSFYFYFESKEAFGLALVDHFTQQHRHGGWSVLRDRSKSPLLRLKEFFGLALDAYREQGFSRGCLLGNMAQEMSDLSPALREKVRAAMNAASGALAAVLTEAVECGELPRELDPRDTAGFLLDAWEGALLRMKAEKSPAPLERFAQFVFSRVLR
jgi:TetR/AcrR family transcriptional repressor of nem operon